MFCPVCGNSKQQQGFCTNCGSELETAATGMVSKKEKGSLFSFEPRVVLEDIIEEPLSEVKESRWRKIGQVIRFHTLWLIAAAVLIALGTGWIRFVFYAQEHAVHDAILAMESRNVNQLAGLLVAPDGSKYPFGELQAFVSSIHAAGVKDQLTYLPKRVGETYGILPNYRVMIQPIQPIVHTNLMGAKWFVNGKAITIQSTNDPERWKLPPLLPQSMELIGIKETPYGSIMTRGIWQPNQWKGEGEPILSAFFEHRIVSFQTDMSGVQLSLNGFPVQEIPYPQGLELALVPSRVEVELEKKVPWGEVIYLTGERSLEQNGVYRVPMKDRMARQVYPMLKRELLEHIESYAIGAQSLDLTQVEGLSEQGIKVLEEEWAPFAREKYTFKGELSQLDLYPDQVTVVGENRAQMIATVYYRDYQWTNDKGENYYETVPGAKTYAYDMIFQDGEWKVHSYKPLTAFVYESKETILIQEENAPHL